MNHISVGIPQHPQKGLIAPQAAATPSVVVEFSLFTHICAFDFMILYKSLFYILYSKLEKCVTINLSIA